MAELWLGFDWGLGWIGVASGQTATYSASSLQSIRARNGIPDWRTVDRLIADWKPAGLVVGIPYEMDGSESAMSQRANKFRQRLHGRFGLPAHAVDERLTSREAWSRLENSAASLAQAKNAHVDSIAAQIILQSWLDGLRAERDA